MTGGTTRDPDKRPVMVHLGSEDFERLTEICEEHGISRADFLRSAIAAAETIPLLQTRPLTGVCLERQKARLAREKRAAVKRNQGAADRAMKAETGKPGGARKSPR